MIKGGIFIQRLHIENFFDEKCVKACYKTFTLIASMKFTVNNRKKTTKDDNYWLTHTLHMKADRLFKKIQ